ncbi:MAG: hypothetical protein IT322_16125 [Anaerolineae bacterium]|nr:hypothetical protein [Anaerolineae bacterium]
MTIKRIFRYFFPKRRVRQRLPLSPLHYSSAHSPWGDPPPELEADIRRLMWQGLAATRQDGYRLLKKHPGKTLREIIRLERRRRYAMPRLRRAWRRWKKVW